jgi:dihydrodipicolinate reductase
MFSSKSQILVKNKNDLQKEASDWLKYYHSHVEAVLYFDSANRRPNELHYLIDVSTPEIVMEQINKSLADSKLVSRLHTNPTELPIGHDSSYYEYFKHQPLGKGEKLYINCIYYKRRIDAIKVEIQEINDLLHSNKQDAKSSAAISISSQVTDSSQSIARNKIK